MSSVIRNGQNLTKFSDGQLAQLVASCICLGVDGDDLADCEQNWQAGGRKMVVKAACAYDLLVSLKTETSVVEPSEESRLWSSMEGGHIFHEVPQISVRELILGHI